MTHPRGTWLQVCDQKIQDQRHFLQEIAKNRVVLLGERHDIAEIHRWQLHTAIYLHALRPNMMMGFEMFPTRVQPILDEWVSGTLTTEEFLQKVEWEKVWGFPPEIYLPLFHFCRQQNIKMLALNCPRELVTRVGKEGWSAIPENERDGLTPSAEPLSGHKAYIRSLTGDRFVDEKSGDIPDRFIRAQQTWDRAFACNIVKALEQAKVLSPDAPEPLVIGIMGKGHIEYGFGTPHQLHDLGVEEVGILISSTQDSHNISEIYDEKNGSVADGIFRVDIVETASSRDK